MSNTSQTGWPPGYTVKIRRTHSQAGYVSDLWFDGKYLRPGSGIWPTRREANDSALAEAWRDNAKRTPKGHHA